MSKIKKDKTTNNDLQNATQKTKDQATRTKDRVEFMCSGRKSRSFSTGDTRRVTLRSKPVIPLLKL